MSRILILLTLLALLGAGENLLLNGGLALDAGGQPTHWRRSEAPVTLAVEPAEAGRPAALRVVLGKAAGEGMGSLAQRVQVPAGARTLLLTGWLRSSAPDIGVLQAKLLAGGKEVRRINSAVSATAWQELRVEIPCEGIDEVAVQCRFSQAERASGQEVCFAGICLQVAP